MSSDIATPRVLFIGNSLTYFNGGIDTHITNMCGNVVICESETRGGATLSRLWRKVPECKRKIRSQKYDVVVLQDDIPELKDLKHFDKFAEKFVKLCRECGSRPVLYMCWAYERLSHKASQTDVEEAHRKFGRRFGVDVVPVGSARELLPNMWADDMEHPSIQGTILASAMILKLLFPNKEGFIWNPSDYLPESVSLEEANRIHEISESWSPPTSSEWAFEQQLLSIAESSTIRRASDHILDEHIILHVSCLLVPEDLVEMAATCSAFHGVICGTKYDSNLWEAHFRRDFGLLQRGRLSWRLVYLAEQNEQALMEAQIVAGMC